MEWSEAVAQQIVAALQARGAPNNCPLCGIGPYTLVQGFVLINAYDGLPIYSLSRPNSGIPCAAITCDNCGNTHLINLVQIGLGHLAMPELRRPRVPRAAATHSLTCQKGRASPNDRGMESEDQKLVTRIRPETQDSRVTIDYRGRRIVMHSVQESELLDIGSIQVAVNVNLAFFTLMVGLAAGFGTVLLTTHSVLSDRLLTLFAGLALITGLASIYFGIRALIEWRQVKQRIAAIIKEGQE
jgi:hypothetical protein